MLILMMPAVLFRKGPVCWPPGGVRLPEARKDFRSCIPTPVRLIFWGDGSPSRRWSRPLTGMLKFYLKI